MDVPSDLARRISLFKAGGKVFREQEELFSKVAWLQVLLGQGIEPQAYHPVADVPTREQLEELLKNQRAAVVRAVSAMPNHQAVLDKL